MNLYRVTAYTDRRQTHTVEFRVRAATEFEACMIVARKRPDLGGCAKIEKIG